MSTGGDPPRGRLRRAWFPALLIGALTLALAFLTIPIIAIFVNVEPGALIDSLGE